MSLKSVVLYKIAENLILISELFCVPKPSQILVIFKTLNRDKVSILLEILKRIVLNLSQSWFSISHKYSFIFQIKNDYLFY